MNQNSSIVVSFMGVDGSGKSTLIELLRKKLKNKFNINLVILLGRLNLYLVGSIIKSWAYLSKMINCFELFANKWKKNL